MFRSLFIDSGEEVFYEFVKENDFLVRLYLTTPKHSTFINEIKMGDDNDIGDVLDRIERSALKDLCKVDTVEMTLGELLTKKWSIDFLVYDNVNMNIDYPPLSHVMLSEDGKKYFSELLALKCLVNIPKEYIEVDIGSVKNNEVCHWHLFHLFSEMAGLGTPTTFKKRFIIY